MSFVESEFQKILRIKKDIYTAIKNKGVDIPNDTYFENYPTEIGKITGSSGGDYPYNNFSATVSNFNDSVSVLNVNCDSLPNYNAYTGPKQYCLMPIVNTTENSNVENNCCKIENNIATFDGISSYIRVKKPFLTYDNSWEVQITFTTGSTLQDGELFHSCSQTSKQTDTRRYGACMLLYENGILNFYCSADDSSWLFDIETDPLPDFDINTTYSIKFGFDGTGYYVINYTDPKHPVEMYRNQITTKITQTSVNFIIGEYFYSASYNHPFKGTMDLSKYKVYIGNNIFWEYQEVEFWQCPKNFQRHIPVFTVYLI